MMNIGDLHNFFIRHSGLDPESKIQKKKNQTSGFPACAGNDNIADFIQSRSDLYK